MSHPTLAPGRWKRVSSWLMSVPLFTKILGIGAGVALLFGIVILPQVRYTISSIFYEDLENKSLAIATSLAAEFERPMAVGDFFKVNRSVMRAKDAHSDLRYIIVRGPDGPVVSHTFRVSPPPDLLSALPEVEPTHRARRWILSSEEGMLFNTLVPILEGRAGSVLVGLTDRRIRSEITSLTHSLFWSLMLCASVGWGLALVLTDIVTRPVRQLVQAASRIQEGDFHVRSEVGSADEIGHLASAFNDMAESLEIHRKDVQEKERVRESLLERIVQVQEEERKRVARELHDEVGQSLSALLLAIQSSRGNGKPTDELKSDLEHQTTQLIGEVHRLAWGMRPSILDDFGLDSALSRLVQEIAKHSSTAIDYQYSAPPGAERPPSRVEVTLYRLAQEALSNVDRHSEAKRASVILLQLPHEVSLLVEDDGQGFELKSLGSGADDCLGIAGMKERVALVGGSLDLASEPGKGTTLRATIPLQEDKE